jgi:molecular chaperone Hsp33
MSKRVTEMSDNTSTSDLMYRGVITNRNVRFAYAQTTSLCNTAVLTHDCDPVAAHIFCRALSAGVLSSMMLTDEERFTIHWKYDGELKSVLIDIGAHGDVRGTVNPTSLGEVKKAGEIFGEHGSIGVVKSDARRQLNSGVTEAALLDVVEDLSYLFSVSDQIETGMVVMVQFVADVEHPVQLCQGFMVQAMPDCDLEAFDMLRQRLDSEPFRQLMTLPPVIDNAFENLVRVATDDPLAGVTSLSSIAPEYRCRCTRDKCRSVLSTIPRAELREAAARDENLTVSCHFCSERYTFDAHDITDLLATTE